MQNMEFPLRERGFDKTEARSIAREWLERLRIGQFEKFFPRQLSGGMKQRLAIARALSVKPDLLILDEPFAAIDAQLRETLQDELLALHQETGMTTVLFTHSFDEAVLLSDRIVVLTPRPATILDVVPVPFTRPRTTDVRREPKFLSTVSTVRSAIKRGAHD
jgi:NitT/TauT family transport system ATP-binding protein